MAVEVEVTRAGAVRLVPVRLARGTRVRDAVRRAGLTPEGTAVFLDGLPVPLDQPLERPVRLIVVPTFSGG